MEHHGKTETELAATLYGKPPKSESTDKPKKDSEPSLEQRREAVSLRLWVRLSEIFGAVFVTQYGDVSGEARQTWKQGLEQYSEDQIKRGVQHCLNWRKDFPPNLPQFLELCLTVPPKSHQPFKPDPMGNTPLLERFKGKTLTEIGKRELDKCLRIAAGLTAADPGNEDLPTFEQAYHALRLDAWWGHLKGARF